MTLAKEPKNVDVRIYACLFHNTYGFKPIKFRNPVLNM